MKAFFRSQAQRLTLRQSLGRTHMVTSLTAVCMAGLLLTGIALLALRIYADHNLELVARAISYTSEAAVVFHDEEVAKEALQAIVTREDVAQASIRLPNGRLLASWSRAMPGRARKCWPDGWWPLAICRPRHLCRNATTAPSCRA